MRIESGRFGTLELNEREIITFPDGLIGFAGAPAIHPVAANGPLPPPPPPPPHRVAAVDNNGRACAASGVDRVVGPRDLCRIIDGGGDSDSRWGNTRRLCGHGRDLRTRRAERGHCQPLGTHHRQRQDTSGRADHSGRYELYDDRAVLPVSAQGRQHASDLGPHTRAGCSTARRSALRRMVGV